MVGLCPKRVGKLRHGVWGGGGEGGSRWGSHTPHCRLAEPWVLGMGCSVAMGWGSPTPPRLTAESAAAPGTAAMG